MSCANLAPAGATCWLPQFTKNLGDRSRHRETRQKPRIAFDVDVTSSATRSCDLPLHATVKILIIAAIVTLCGCGRKEASVKTDWPDLSKYQATVGRAATSNDVAAGRAVFVLQSQGQPIGQPIVMLLPQYAIHNDPETKTTEPCIVIQAEEANGQRLIGCYMLPSNQMLAGFVNEFTLLGQKKPE